MLMQVVFYATLAKSITLKSLIRFICSIFSTIFDIFTHYKTVVYSTPQKQDISDD